MKKSKKSFVQQDEELVLLCQQGHDPSWEKLTQRYLYRARGLANFVLPEYTSFFQQCDVEECMLISLMNAVYAYKTGVRGFFKFMVVVYRNELIKMLEENKTFIRYSCISLSDSVPGSEESLTFEDVIADTKEDSASFCNTMFQSSNVKDAMGKLDSLTKNIVMLKLQGMRYQEIADALGISYKIARTRYLKYKALMDKKINKGSHN